MAAESPLHQFELVELLPIRIGGVNLSFTNSSLWMLVAIAGITLFLTLGMRQRALVPGRWQSMAEMSYQFIANLVRDNAGNEGMQYFPFIFTLFMFILLGNVLGHIPRTDISRWTDAEARAYPLKRAKAWDADHPLAGDRDP